MNLEMVLKYLELGSQILGAICVAATLLVRFFPKYSGQVDGLVGKFYKLLHFLPTIGVNPQTKQLEAALAELKK